MSIFSKVKPIESIQPDEVYVIYGKPGTGKTSLASTFPHDDKHHMLLIDVLEGGGSAVGFKQRPNIDVLQISTFEELDEVLTGLYNGFYIDDKGKQVPLKYATVVIDTVTQVEWLLKEYLKKNESAKTMSLRMWGVAKDSQENMYNLLKSIHQTTGARVVGICHEKQVTDEENPGNNKIIPALMNSAATLLCAKASYVWYTKIEESVEIDEATNEARPVLKFNTYIGPSQAYVTKCRVPKEYKYPTVIRNMSYPWFFKNIIKPVRDGAPTDAPDKSDGKEDTTNDKGTET